YLSGLSGVGKSSLLYAYVVPKLNRAHWKIVRARAFGNPYQQVLTGLHAIAEFPETETDLIKALALVASTLSPPGRLLLIVDQFEEFIILHDAEVLAQTTSGNLGAAADHTSAKHREALAAFRSFLDSFVAHPIAGIRLVLVIREEYIGRMGDL